MSGFEDWPHIDELFRKLAGLLSSARQARNTLQASIDARQLHIARYPSFGDVTRWEQISACDAGWWCGRRLVPDGDILRLTKSDGVTEDHEWQIVVSPDDAAALWPHLAPTGMDPKTWIMQAIEHRLPDERNVTQFATRVAPEMKAAMVAGECTKAWTVKTIINRIADYKLWPR